MTQRKILVLGASGFIGRHMAARLGRDGVLATRFRSPLDNAVVFDALTQTLAEIVPDPGAIAHAMVFYGDTMPDSCARDPVHSQALNVDSTKRVIDQLVQWGIPFTFTSSESVFDGTRGNNDEDCPPNPIMLYGRQKVEIEVYLRERHPNAAWTVFRLGKVFGSTSLNEKLFTGWIDAIEAERLIKIATDQIFSPIYVEDVVGTCLLAAQKGVRGLFHLCGVRPYSRYELLLMTIKEVERYRPMASVIEKCSIDDFALIEPRPKDCSMSPARVIAATGTTITPTESVCRQIVDDYYRLRRQSQPRQ